MVKTKVVCLFPLVFVHYIRYFKFRRALKLLGESYELGVHCGFFFKRYITFPIECRFILADTLNLKNIRLQKGQKAIPLVSRDFVTSFERYGRWIDLIYVGYNSRRKRLSELFNACVDRARNDPDFVSLFIVNCPSKKNKGFN